MEHRRPSRLKTEVQGGLLWENQQLLQTAFITAAGFQCFRDRVQIRNLDRRYSFGVDSIDFDLVRSVFHPDCVVVGTVDEGAPDVYLGVEHERRIIRRENAKQW